MLYELFTKHLMSALAHSLWQAPLFLLAIAILKNANWFSHRLKQKLATHSLYLFLILFMIQWYWGPMKGFALDLLNNIWTWIDPSILAILWVIGFVFSLFRFTISKMVMRRLLSQSIEAPQEWSSLFEHLLKRSGLHKTIRMRVSRAPLHSAFVTGFLKPIIIIPLAWINELSMQEAEQILTHELAHLKNKDQRTLIFLQITQMFFFFNPAIYYWIHWVRNEQEINADQEVVRYYPLEIKSYGELILKLSGTKNGASQLAMHFIQPKFQLKERILNLIGKPTKQYIPWSHRLVFSICLLSSFVLIVRQPVMFSPQVASNEISSPTDIVCNTIPTYDNQSLLNAPLSQRPKKKRKPIPIHKVSKQEFIDQTAELKVSGELNSAMQKNKQIKIHVINLDKDSPNNATYGNQAAQASSRDELMDILRETKNIRVMIQKIKEVKMEDNKKIEDAPGLILEEQINIQIN